MEGEKASIHPILEWIFKNVDILKERAYLAKYLTKIEIPGFNASLIPDHFRSPHWHSLTELTVLYYPSTIKIDLQCYLAKLISFYLNEFGRICLVKNLLVRISLTSDQPYNIYFFKLT